MNGYKFNIIDKYRSIFNLSIDGVSFKTLLSTRLRLSRISTDVSKHLTESGDLTRINMKIEIHYLFGRSFIRDIYYISDLSLESIHFRNVLVITDSSGFSDIDFVMSASLLRYNSFGINMSKKILYINDGEKDIVVAIETGTTRELNIHVSHN